MFFKINNSNNGKIIKHAQIYINKNCLRKILMSKDLNLQIKYFKEEQNIFKIKIINLERVIMYDLFKSQVQIKPHSKVLFRPNLPIYQPMPIHKTSTKISIKINFNKNMEIIYSNKKHFPTM